VQCMPAWLSKLFRRWRPSAPASAVRVAAPVRGATAEMRAAPRAEPRADARAEARAVPSSTDASGAPVEVAPAAEPMPVVLLRQPSERVDAAVAALANHFAFNPPRLGAFPGTAARILQLFKESDPDFNRVVHELQQDAAVVTKLLNVANSAFFAGGEDVNDIRGAVLRIGMRDVSQIALGVAGQSLFEPSSRSAFALVPAKWNELFHTSMSAAFATAWLSQVARVGRSDHAFLSGLLHDVGQPTALRGLAQLVIEGTLDRDVLADIDQILDATHIEIGTSVTTLSALPEYLCAAAAKHHDAEVPPGPEHAEVHLVRIIDGIAAQRRAALTPAQKSALEASASALALDPRWMHVAVTEYETLAAQVTRMFGVADPFAGQASQAAAAR
jgi:HD-like signal output (HDOD) protein